MPIQIKTGKNGWTQAKASFKINKQFYFQEALGLAVFMASACFFSAILFSVKSEWYYMIPASLKDMVMGVLMGATALFIFYSPLTAASGSQINPAVTLVFFRLGKMCRWDTLFYIIFQFAGGTIAVYLMQFLMGDILINPPVNSAVTVPGTRGLVPALAVELVIAFITMSMVLFTSASERLKKYTRVMAACLVCCWVIVAGPVSGFGMNPARTFASALPSRIWIGWWIYFAAPVAGMLCAAEFFLWYQRFRISPKKLLV
ncbi:MAG: aquaporin [Ferruginibacter sp.]